MKTGTGEVPVPKDTKMIGHITEAQARTKEQKESQVGIAFDQAMMKDGRELSLPMSIRAVVAPAAPSFGNANSYGGPPSPAPSSETSGNAGRPGGMNNGAGMPSQTSSTSAGGEQSAAPSGNIQPAVDANTRGIVGLSDLNLSAGGQGANGSLITSAKKNVKLGSGTLMLLRVNR